MTDAERLERARRLRLLRTDLVRVSQDAFAERSGGKLERTYVVKMENGKNQLTSVDMFRGVAKAAGLNLEDLALYLDGSLSFEEVSARASIVPAELAAAQERGTYLPVTREQATLRARSAANVSEGAWEQYLATLEAANLRLELASITPVAKPKAPTPQHPAKVLADFKAKVEGDLPLGPPAKAPPSSKKRSR